ncbi:uncharacterized protein ASPGLDRAFT_46279 [Aspergillus glaucus CBS 516.65]|uniref:Uncharacterized protein n=1 Tax=Aspergillus glaucus CBS 516.65 TaxID=1160497 RepID=A0A1L9VMX3_ASPGL|nr:hypothetical protein ASPGLDRAFT_46279 [Aspergillus glaucus CBS 516.65]OJJ85277.1 hypothetical protein ASPGLDRAFT_46279 [Aspergillus glaucus CBS 516.65]
MGDTSILCLDLAKTQPGTHLGNPMSGFAAAGLIPFEPERVLAKLHIKMKTPTPPSSSSSNQILLFREDTSQSLSVEPAKKADSRPSKPVSIFSCCRADA